MMRLSSISLFIFVLLIGFPPPGSSTTQQDTSSCFVGEFTVRKVIDGDTIALEGLEDTIRLVCVDTEECEKGRGAEERTRAIARNYSAYVRQMLQHDPMKKFSTPMGWEAKCFADKCLPVGSMVRIEYDSPCRKTGYYNRVLGYLFFERDGEWFNFNVECVRAGMSPYFEKYGSSQRFAMEFLAAEREARIHQRGIWSPYAMAYPNYDERISWWWRRARTMTRFEERCGDQERAVCVMDEDDWARLAGLEGQDVLLFGALAKIRDPQGKPLLELHHKQSARVDVTFDPPGIYDLLHEFLSSIEADGDLFYVRGELQRRSRANSKNPTYGIVVRTPGQVFADIPGVAVKGSFPWDEIEWKESDIHWRKGHQHLGEAVSLVGQIVRTKNIGSVTFLNFDPDYRNTISLVILKEDYSRFSEPPEEVYRDRMIRVLGEVTEHEGTHQIRVTDSSQIEILR